MQHPTSRSSRRYLAIVVPAIAFAAAIALCSLPAIGSAFDDAAASELPNSRNTVTIPTDTIRNDGLYNMFIIKGGKITPELLASGRFIRPENISYSGRPDSQLRVVYRHSNAIGSCDKNDILQLCTGYSTIEVDGKEVSLQEFMKIPSSLIATATLDGNILKIETLSDVNSRNKSGGIYRRDEQRWLAAQLNRSNDGSMLSKFSDVVIDDFSTYPSDIPVDIDRVYRSIDDAKALKKSDIAMIDWTVIGDYVSVKIFTDGYAYTSIDLPIEYQCEFATDRIKTPSISAIATEAPEAWASHVNFIRYSPSYIGVASIGQLTVPSDDPTRILANVVMLDNKGDTIEMLLNWDFMTTPEKSGEKTEYILTDESIIDRLSLNPDNVTDINVGKDIITITTTLPN